MAKFHTNPATGDVSACKALKEGCPFGDASEHHSTADEARKAYEASQSMAIDESGETWPPVGLPKKLEFAATVADLIRAYNDETYNGAEGVCLGVSAYISHMLIKKDIPHKLVRGEYLLGEEKKSHWWIKSSNWIIDASRGQFHEESYKSSVIPAHHPKYSTLEEFDPGHVTEELVLRELQGCFGAPSEAVSYLNTIGNIEFQETIWRETQAKAS